MHWERYREAVESGRIPLGSATRFSPQAQEERAIKMALSTLQPVLDAVHRQRFGTSLHDAPWRDRFESLAARGLVTTDDSGVRLTPDGEVLVEAIINADFASEA